MNERAVRGDEAAQPVGARGEKPRELTTREAAAWLESSERSVRRAIARGALLARRQGRGYRVALADLENYRAAPEKHAARPQLLRLPAPVVMPSPPIPQTPLVGRIDELATARALLIDDGARLLTLTGPGGVGKTRLALEIGHALVEEFADGVAFIDLAPIRDPEGIDAAIAHVLGVREAGERSIEEGLVAYLRHRDLLLLLDNFEHLLAAAPLVSRLLANCLRLVVLTTSRAPLRLRGERLQSVPPLRVEKSGGREAECEAVQLFAARAQAARTDFVLRESNANAVAIICQRVDGLPLAIELAAARCAALSPEELLARLDRRLPLLAAGPRDVASRHQSLHEAIAWSYDLLSNTEQAAFRRLSVFVGGFTLDGAREMLGRGDALRSAPLGFDSSASLDLVTSLHAQSLLTRQENAAGAVRFAMLETVREFARERLAEHGEEEAALRDHAKRFLRLAEDVATLMPMPDSWWEQFEREWSNLRAALSWSVSCGEPQLALRLGGALFGYWMLRGQIGEGIGWLEQALAVGTRVPAVVCGRAMMALGSLTWVAGDLERSERVANEALMLLDREGDAVSAGVCRFLQGFLAETSGDLAGAEVCLRDAQRRYAMAGFAEGIAAAGGHLGRIVGLRGDREEAKAILKEAIVTLDSPNGGLWGAATAYSDLGLLVAADGDLKQAAALIDKGLRHHAAIGDQLVVLVSLAAAAQVVAEAGAAAAGAQLAGAAFGLRERAGPSIWAVARPRCERAELAARAAMSDVAYGEAWAAGRLLDTDDAIAAARSALALVMGGGSGAETMGAVEAIALTSRELAVVRLIAAGQTDREIAQTLGLRVPTVNTHVANIRRKLGVASRTAAAATAVRRGLV